MIWVLRLFGYPVLTFGPESLCDELEDDLQISNTGGSFSLATEQLSPEEDEEEWASPDDPIYSFGFGGGSCQA